MSETLTREEVDLTPFCSTEEVRYYLKTPWSRGDYSYATNGHVLVRVSRRADVPENEKSPDADRLFTLYPASDFIAAAPLDLPPQNERPCDRCEATGHFHPCDGCECGECEECDGRLVTSDDYKCAVRVLGVEFAQKYVRIIWSLPGLRLQEGPIKREGPMNFRFDGGEGQVMPLRAPLPGDYKVLAPSPVPPSK